MKRQLGRLVAVLSCQTQKEGQQPIHADHGGFVDLTNRRPDPFSLHGHGLVQHDLRGHAQSIVGGLLNCQSEEWRVN